MFLFLNVGSLCRTKFYKVAQQSEDLNIKNLPVSELKLKRQNFYHFESHIDGAQRQSIIRSQHQKFSIYFKIKLKNASYDYDTLSSLNLADGSCTDNLSPLFPCVI